MTITDFVNPVVKTSPPPSPAAGQGSTGTGGADGAPTDGTGGTPGG
jgi:hypothetical protein